MIVDLEVAKGQLRRLDDYDDERIALLLVQANAIVLGYLKVDEDLYEDTSGLNDYPTLVAAAVLLVLDGLYMRPDQDPLSSAVQSILERSRDPALA